MWVLSAGLSYHSIHSFKLITRCFLLLCSPRRHLDMLCCFHCWRTPKLSRKSVCFRASQWADLFWIWQKGSRTESELGQNIVHAASFRVYMEKQSLQAAMVERCTAHPRKCCSKANCQLSLSWHCQPLGQPPSTPRFSMQCTQCSPLTHRNQWVCVCVCDYCTPESN